MKYMKIALLAFVVALGASCKKEVTAPVEAENVSKKADIRWDLPGTGTPPSTITYDNQLDPADWGYPYNPNVFPHNTGACTCGMFSNCHPNTYSIIWYDGQDLGHIQVFDVRPGQVKFPQGAIFSP